MRWTGSRLHHNNKEGGVGGSAGTANLEKPDGGEEGEL